MPTTSATPDLKSSPAVVEIERLGFEWDEVAEYELSRLSPKHRVQVREVDHYAPKDAVERFAIMMGESKFPPIVVTSDEWIIDGNTRVGAKLLRKEPFTRAIVLKVARTGASQKVEDDLHILAATLNACAGTGLTTKEIRVAAKHFIARGFKDEQIARAIGLRPSSIVQVKKEIAAADKLTKVGLGSNGALRGASLRALGAKDVVGLNDEPFKELATLAADAGLNASEIVALAKVAKESGSDAGAVTTINAERGEFADRIRERKLTGVGKPPVSRQLRQHLGFVTKFAGREQELIETDPKVNATHIEVLRNSIAVLETVLKMQDR